MVGQPIMERFGQPVSALITKRKNVYKKHISQSTPSHDEDTKIVVETLPCFQ